MDQATGIGLSETWDEEETGSCVQANRIQPLLGHHNDSGTEERKMIKVTILWDKKGR
jgi:hypothetical protein